MRALKTIFAISLATAGTAILLMPAEAQRVAARQHLQCIVLGDFGLFNGGGLTNLVIVNSTSQTIAAGTVYTYGFGGTPRTLQSSAALPPGASLPFRTGGSSSTCTAWIMVPFKTTIMAPLQNAPLLAR